MQPHNKVFIKVGKDPDHNKEQSLKLLKLRDKKSQKTFLFSALFFSAFGYPAY